MLNTLLWVVVVVDNEKPETDFHIGHYHVRRLRTTDMESAAEEAVVDWHAAMAEYPDVTRVGVAPPDDMLDVDYSYPGSLVSPDRFTWFTVECSFVPSYRTRRLRKEVV